MARSSSPPAVNSETPLVGRQDEEEAQVSRFLARLYSVAKLDEHRAVDEVFNFMDDHLLADRFSLCELALRRVEPALVPSSALVSFLMVSLRAKPRLSSSRPAFLAKAIEAVTAREGREQAEALLGKYR